MSLGAKSAADIQAIIDAALGKKPLLPKGLEQEIQMKEAAVAARKAAKAKAATNAVAEDEKRTQSVSKTLGKAVTAKIASKKVVEKKMRAEKAAKAKAETLKTLKKGSVAMMKKKKADKLEKLKTKAVRKTRKGDKKVAAAIRAEEKALKEAAEETDDLNADESNDEALDSDVDSEMFDGENIESEDDEAYAEMKQQQLVESALNRAITGGADKDALAEDPLAATFGGSLFAANMREEAVPSSSLLHTLAQQKASEYVPQEALLSDAHKFFSVLSETEKKRNMLARKKIAEMRAVNKRGGDKDGFKYVLPTSVKSYARQLAGDGVDIPENLASHFQGDGVQDTDKAPSRKKEKKRYHDDFYQFQVAQKWTKNAENFLNKARSTKNMFISRQQKLRTTKMM